MSENIEEIIKRVSAARKGKISDEDALQLWEYYEKEKPAANSEAKTATLRVIYNEMKAEWREKRKAGEPTMNNASTKFTETFWPKFLDAVNKANKSATAPAAAKARGDEDGCGDEGSDGGSDDERGDIGAGSPRRKRKRLASTPTAKGAPSVSRAAAARADVHESHASLGTILCSFVGGRCPGTPLFVLLRALVWTPLTHWILFRATTPYRLHLRPNRAARAHEA